MQIHVLPIFSDNYAYLIEHEGHAAVVDPAEPGPVLEALKEKNLTLDLILNTHHHFDHVSGNDAVKKATGCRITGPDDSRIPGLDEPVGEGDTVAFAHGLRVIATSGHGSADLSFYLPAEGGFTPGAVFTGDTLFAGGCGRLFECGPAEMWNSLKKLAALPEDTRVYCGHEYTESNYAFALSILPDHDRIKARAAEVQRLRVAGHPSIPSSIGEEKASNPFLLCDTEMMAAALGMPDRDSADIFGELRHRKDVF